jgi:hypothetical protein
MDRLFMCDLLRFLSRKMTEEELTFLHVNLPGRTVEVNELRELIDRLADHELAGLGGRGSMSW